jgi:hypothetical protein
VADYGAFALDYAHSENVEKTANWSLLLAIFQSSQTAEFSTTQTTYDELKSAGELRLIGNVELRTIISSYYTNSGNPALTERPKYREHVRGYIPISVQHYIWDNCYSSDAYGGQIMFECDAPAQLSNAGEIVDSIVTNEELMREMRYWMSTLRVASIIGQDRIEAAIDLQKIIEAELNGANPETTP